MAAERSRAILAGMASHLPRLKDLDGLNTPFLAPAAGFALGQRTTAHPFSVAAGRDALEPELARRVRVLIVCADPSERLIVKQLLRRYDGVEVICEARTGREAFAAMEQERKQRAEERNTKIDARRFEQEQRHRAMTFEEKLAAMGGPDPTQRITYRERDFERANRARRQRDDRIVKSGKPARERVAGSEVVKQPRSRLFRKRLESKA